MDDDDELLLDANNNEDDDRLLGYGLVSAGNKLYQLNTTYESLDYEIEQSSIRQVDQERLSKKSETQKEVERWFCCLLIGVSVGLTGIMLTVSIDLLATLKIKLLQSLFNGPQHNWLPELVWVGINFTLVAVASTLTVFIAPVASGSGIPQIKCFLNGVKIPQVIRLKALIVKFIGIVLAVVGGLAVGKEGPMVHAGAVLAGGISQGQSESLGWKTSLFEQFRDDHEKRDFVAAGAAAGVSAAFGAPVGGVLFALEEAASFWNQALTWRIFFTSVISFITLDFGLSSFKGEPGNLTSPGLLNFGQFEHATWFYYELPIFALMGVVGGLLGCFFVIVNKNITVLRAQLKMSKLAKSLEAALVATLSAAIMVLLLNLNPRCRHLDEDDFFDVDYKLRMNCPEGMYNSMSLLCFGTPEVAVKAMFHQHWDYFHITSLLMFFPAYWALSVVTYGVAVPSGLFVPALLCGATWGRMIGLGLNSLSVCQFAGGELYALIGAAAGLGGTVRMTLSLCVILLEATGNMTLVLPITIVLIISKQVADYFNDGIYDTHIHLWGVPILEWSAPPKSDLIEVGDVMSRKVVKLNHVEQVAELVQTLSSEEHHHNGFPVIDETSGKLIGLILRSRLLSLLKHRKFDGCDLLRIEDIRDDYPRFYPISQIQLEPGDTEREIDLRPYLNQSPAIVSESTTLAKIFQTFRALGLRHLVVVDDQMRPVGMITRKDISRFRHEHNSIHRLPVDPFQHESVVYD